MNTAPVDLLAGTLLASSANRARAGRTLYAVSLHRLLSLNGITALRVTGVRVDQVAPDGEAISQVTYVEEIRVERSVDAETDLAETLGDEVGALLFESQVLARANTPHSWSLPEGCALFTVEQLVDGPDGKFDVVVTRHADVDLDVIVQYAKDAAQDVNVSDLLVRS